MANWRGFSAWSMAGANNRNDSDPLEKGDWLLRSLLNDGIFAGVGSVLVFLPQIHFEKSKKKGVQ